MTYTKPKLPRQTPISLPDYLIDLFGRVRTSDPVIQLQVTQSDPSILLEVTEGQVSGSNTTSVFSPESANTVLSVGSTDGLRRLRTRVPGLYQAGKSLLFLFTFNFGGNGDSLGFTLRSSVSGVIVETTALRDSWNFDKFDGTGPTGISLDLSKCHIGFLAFEWLCVGDVACGFIHNRIPSIAHVFEHANKLTDVYMRTANLFPTFEIEKKSGIITKRLGYFDDKDGVFLKQIGGSSSLKTICASLINEGAIDKTGTTYSINRNIGDIYSTGTSNSPRALMLFRLNPSHINSRVLITSVEITVTDTTNYYLSLCRQPTFSSTITPNWASLTNRSLQYDNDPNTSSITVTNVNTSSIWTTSGSSGRNSTATSNFSINSVDYLGSEYDGTPEIWALVITCDGSNINIPTVVIRFVEEI